MFDYQPLYRALQTKKANDWAHTLPLQLKQAFDVGRHRRLPEWQDAIAALPVACDDYRSLTEGAVRIGHADSLSAPERACLSQQLQCFIPWRKGPYELFGTYIDTEWRSDWKWDRLKDHITPLTGRWVLDVGCGNGYHCWRMFGAGAEMVIGVDPLMLNVMQFQAMRTLYGEAPVHVLPFALEELPKPLQLFDSVFSMGVIYHRRSPIDHLLALKQCLQPGGELILESLIVDGETGYSLVPEERYANMRNVWFIPACTTLTSWLKRCGFTRIRTVDITPTTTQEQRSTLWMPYKSLADSLDADQPGLTIEGLPAPKRAILIASAL